MAICLSYFVPYMLILIIVVSTSLNDPSQKKQVQLLLTESAKSALSICQLINTILVL